MHCSSRCGLPAKPYEPFTNVLFPLSVSVQASAGSGAAEEADDWEAGCGAPQIPDAPYVHCSMPLWKICEPGSELPKTVLFHSAIHCADVSLCVLPISDPAYRSLQFSVCVKAEEEKAEDELTGAAEEIGDALLSALDTLDAAHVTVVAKSGLRLFSRSGSLVALVMSA